MDEKQPEKTALAVLKDFISPDDLRSLLALIVTVGGLVVIAMHPIVEVVSPITALIMVALQWYFDKKKRES